MLLCRKWNCSQGWAGSDKFPNSEYFWKKILICLIRPLWSWFETTFHLEICYFIVWNWSKTFWSNLNFILDFGVSTTLLSLFLHTKWRCSALYRIGFLAFQELVSRQWDFLLDQQIKWVPFCLDSPGMLHLDGLWAFTGLVTFKGQ